MNSPSFSLLFLSMALLAVGCQNANFSSGTYIRSISVFLDSASTPYQRFDFSYQGNQLEEVQIIQTVDEQLLGKIQYKYTNGNIQQISHFRTHDTLTHYHQYWYDGAGRLARETTTFPDPDASQSSFGSEYLYLDDSTWLVKRFQNDLLEKVDSLLLFPAQNRYRFYSEQAGGYFLLDATFETGTGLFAYLDQVISPSISALDGLFQHPWPIANSGQHPWLSGNWTEYTLRSGNSPSNLRLASEESRTYTYDDSGRITKISRITNVGSRQGAGRWEIEYEE